MIFKKAYQKFTTPMLAFSQNLYQKLKPAFLMVARSLYQKSVAIFSDTKEIFGPNTNSPPIKGAMQFGMVVLLIFFLVFVSWAVLAPLDTAALARGKVIVAANRKTIQHLEGGIIKQIFIREGSVVNAGAPLIQLDDTQAKATYSLLHSQSNHLYAAQARLTAQVNNEEQIQFPPELLKQQNDPDVQKWMAMQQSLFESERKTFEGQMQILQQRLAQLDKQIQSYQAQVASSNKQLTLIEGEEQIIAGLEKKRYVEKPRLWALQREAARLLGNRDELLGSIAQTEQKIGETQQEILTSTDKRQKETLEELSNTQSKLMDVLEREKTARDILNRTMIIAPQAGVVVDLKEHTVGGIISAGKPVLDLVPSQAELIIEARVSPLDIDVIHTGLPTKVQLVAYKLRNMPWIEGKVTHVSADIFTDPKTQEPYYMTQITIPNNSLENLKDVNLYPGMPVEVMIVTDKRTPWQYFFSPLFDSFNRAFREQ